jgi:hypothetical protein
VLDANAVPTLKGNAIVHNNNTAIIDLLLILPPPCPNRDSNRFNICESYGLNPTINYYLLIKVLVLNRKNGRFRVVLMI